MLHCNSPWRCMSVGVACRTMGFKTLPKSRKELKERFITLAKEHHPDQNAHVGVDSTATMVQVTEAYKTLKRLLNTGVHATDMHAAVISHQRRHAGGFDASATDVAASFVAPGVSISTYGFTLPWQRSATRSQVAQMMEKLDNARDLSFSDYVSAVRSVERERSQTEAARKRDAASANGSHGFTADYFESLRAAKRNLRGGAEEAVCCGTQSVDLGKPLPTAPMPLALRFYGRRLSTAIRHAPRRGYDAIRYIVFGH